MPEPTPNGISVNLPKKFPGSLRPDLQALSEALVHAMFRSDPSMTYSILGASKVLQQVVTIYRGSYAPSLKCDLCGNVIHQDNMVWMVSCEYSFRTHPTPDSRRATYTKNLFVCLDRESCRFRAAVKHS